MPAKVILTVIEGNLKGQKFEFGSRTTCIIGRGIDCYPQLPSDKHHNAISRYHCLLDINPPKIRVRDLGSLYGTYVNGKNIGQRLAHQTREEAAKMNFPDKDLVEGDELKLSKTVFRVSMEVDSKTEPNLENQGAAHIGFQKLNIVTIQSLLDRQGINDGNLIEIRGYTITKKLGEGRFSEVYLASHQQTGELVALKMMLPQVVASKRGIEIFRRETENTKALNHINVVGLKGYGFSHGIFFLILEYCNAGTVLDLMHSRGGRLSIEEAEEIILQTLEGLEYAHNLKVPYVKKPDGKIGKGQGLIHRDIKPANIFLSGAGGNTIAKLGDYGLSKAFDGAGLGGQTLTDVRAGTPFFMPRQQVINYGYAKPEVDIWATAASLYNMLTGAYPRNFGSRDPFPVILNHKPVPIRQRNALIPKPLAELIDFALIDNPQIHFKNVAAFKQALLSVV